MDVLIFGDSFASPAMRHEVPVPVPDDFVYAERNGKRYVAVYSHELMRMREADGLDAHAFEELGWDELIAQGLSRGELLVELTLRACRELGITSAAVPPKFPVAVADHLRANGVDVVPDAKLFAQRRRVKNQAELAGIRRAQRACEAAMAATAEMLRRSEPRGDQVLLDREALTCERIKAVVGQIFTEHETTAEEFIVSHGARPRSGTTWARARSRRTSRSSSTSSRATGNPAATRT